MSAALTLGLAPQAVQAAIAPPAAAPCKASVTPKGARCALATVPLDHSGQVAGTLRVGVVLAPATGASKGTVAVITGGPGEAATPLSKALSRVLSPVRRNYDLLFVDQRGTGADEVQCKSISRPAGVRRCADALGQQRPFLNTRETALDLEDVREALAIPKLIPLGISYGGTVAGQYARRFPDRTAGVILDSPSPVDGLDTVENLRQLGLPRVLREVCFPPSCRDFISDPTVALKTLVRKLQRRPLRGREVLPSGRTRAAKITLDDIFALVASSDEDPLLRAELPAAIASGVLGDPAPLIRLASAASSGGSKEDTGAGNARLLATSCIEGRLPWAPESPVADRDKALADYLARTPKAVFEPFGPTTVLRNSLVAPCSVWPSTPKPEGVAQQGPDVPVLVLAGREDLRTPLEDARRTAGQYPNAQILAVPNIGHSVLTSDPSTCAIRGVVTFLAGGKAGPGCAVRPPAVERAPFIPESLGDLKAAGGVPGAAGRVTTAVAATLVEFGRLSSLEAASLRSGSIRIPGLRGGVAVLTRSRTTLRAYEVVRGVKVSGTATKRASALVITAPGGITGVLTGGKGTVLRGTIGGRKVRLDLG